MPTQLDKPQPSKTKRAKRTKRKVNVTVIHAGDAQGGGVSYTVGSKIEVHGGETGAPDIHIDDLMSLEEQADVKSASIGGAKADGGKITVKVEGVMKEIIGAPAKGGKIEHTKGETIAVTGGETGAATSDAAVFKEVASKTGVKSIVAGNAKAAGAKVRVTVNDSIEEEEEDDDDDDVSSEDEDDGEGDEYGTMNVEGAVVKVRMH